MSPLHSFVRKIKKIPHIIRAFLTGHKIWSAFIILVLIGIGYWTYSALTNTSGQTHYVLGTVASGTVVASLTESGQVTASNTLNIEPQVSGQITYLPVHPGESVNAGQQIASIDSIIAQEALTSAKQNLQSAQLSLAKLQEPPTTLTLTQQKDSISQAQQSLLALYQSSFSDVTNAFVDLPTIIAGLQNIDLGTQAGGTNQWNIDYYESQTLQYSSEAQSFRDAAYNDYLAALQSYNQTLEDFKSASSTPDQTSITQLLKETYTTTGLVATAVKSSNDLLEFYTNELNQNGATPKALAATQITSLNTYGSQAQGHLTTLLNDTNQLQNDQDQITQNQETLSQTQAGPDPIDVQTDQLAIAKAQEAVQEAENTLAEYYVTAPFSGTIGSISANVYDQAGPGTILVTLITNNQYADLSVNEVDAAQIQLGDKATLTFAALSNLTLTGTVASIDPVGIVSQGVVTYDVRVALDTQNQEVKSGMTVNAAIITAAHQNVLTVPASAIQTISGSSYVAVFSPTVQNTGGAQGILSSTPPILVPVVIGLSDGKNTEIISGLTQGEQIVTKTISGSNSTPTAATTATSRGFGGGGAAVRIPGA